MCELVRVAKNEQGRNYEKSNNFNVDVCRDGHRGAFCGSECDDRVCHTGPGDSYAAKPVPQGPDEDGYDDVDGARRETGVETPLPDRARIGLAETVFLEFTRVDAK